ncbi:MAG: TatD family hydrolase [Cellvibrionales bacterium]|nr:TatD family hydrolase [Cellvibrionales bacterium]
MIDSHCHLDLLNLDSHQGSLSAALDAARARGLRGFLCIGIDLDKAPALLELTAASPDIWLALGVHPLTDPLLTDASPLREYCARPEVIAIGETGLDYHYDDTNRAAQKHSFDLHLQTAADLDKPVVVHTRAAQADTLDLLGTYAGKTIGIMHCFTESWAMARRALDLGYYISISGIVTFRNAENVRDVARQVPLDRLLVETDSPYLAPVPYRGKPNQPAYLPETVAYLAELRGMTAEDLAQQTTTNFHRLFPTTHADIAALEASPARPATATAPHPA